MAILPEVPQGCPLRPGVGPDTALQTSSRPPSITHTVLNSFTNPGGGGSQWGQDCESPKESVLHCAFKLVFWNHLRSFLPECYREDRASRFYIPFGIVVSFLS